MYVLFSYPSLPPPLPPGFGGDLKCLQRPLLSVSHRPSASVANHHQSNFSGPNFTKSQAVMMIQNLSVDERKMFLKELKKVVSSNKEGGDLRPSYQDLKQLAYHNSLPFVGFGFLDNFIMIMAGEYIDLTLGTPFPL